MFNVTPAMLSLLTVAWIASQCRQCAVVRDKSYCAGNVGSNGYLSHSCLCHYMLPHNMWFRSANTGRAYCAHCAQTAYCVCWTTVTVQLPLLHHSSLLRVQLWLVNIFDALVPHRVCVLLIVSYFKQIFKSVLFLFDCSTTLFYSKL